jgi:hypothetical protein
MPGTGTTTMGGAGTTKTGGVGTNTLMPGAPTTTSPP